MPNLLVDGWYDVSLREVDMSHHAKGDNAVALLIFKGFDRDLFKHVLYRFGNNTRMDVQLFQRLSNTLNKYLTIFKVKQLEDAVGWEGRAHVTIQQSMKDDTLINIITELKNK